MCFFLIKFSNGTHKDGIFIVKDKGAPISWDFQKVPLNFQLLFAFARLFAVFDAVLQLQVSSFGIHT